MPAIKADIKKNFNAFRMKERDHKGYHEKSVVIKARGFKIAPRFIPMVRSRESHTEMRLSSQSERDSMLRLVGDKCMLERILRQQ